MSKLFYILIAFVAFIAFLSQNYYNEIIMFTDKQINEYGNELLINGYLPDWLIRIGVRLSLKERLRSLYEIKDLDLYVNSFVNNLKNHDLTASATKEANEQHYEVGVSFYDNVLGFYKKYSSTIYLTDNEKLTSIYTNPPQIKLNDALKLLNNSEIDMINLSILRSQLCFDSNCAMNVLDLGCGWGSFSLYYAQRCPQCNIVSMSNSRTQIDYIKQKAKQIGLNNIYPIVFNVNNLNFINNISDINHITGVDMDKFDRIISIEMFEHMKNYDILLDNLKKLIKCNGKLFIHMFVHRDHPYNFEDGWMSEHFFTAGTMLSHNMLTYFNNSFKQMNSWIVNGRHYGYTSETWLNNMDINKKEIKKAIGEIYGNDDKTINKWWYLWRTFFIACSELFHYNNGDEWFVAHYLMEPKC